MTYEVTSNHNTHSLGLLAWRVTYGSRQGTPTLQVDDAFDEAVAMLHDGAPPTCLQRLWFLPDDTVIVLWSHDTKAFRRAAFEFVRKRRTQGDTFAERPGFWIDYVKRRHVAPYILEDRPPLDYIVTALQSAREDAEFAAGAPTTLQTATYQTRLSERRKYPMRWSFAESYTRQQKVNGATIADAMTSFVCDEREQHGSAGALGDFPRHLNLLVEDTHAPDAREAPRSRVPTWCKVRSFDITIRLAAFRLAILEDLRQRRIQHRTDGKLMYLVNRLPPWALIKYEEQWLCELFPQCFQAVVMP